MLTRSSRQDSAEEGNPEPEANDGHLRERWSGSPEELFFLGACE